MVKLTQSLVSSLAELPADADRFEWDDELKGFGLRMRSGRLSWIIQYRVGGRQSHGTQGTGEIEWYTPGQFIESARSVMGSIDLDPATSALAQEVVRANRFFTKDDDGLTKEWCGNVWLNPPYAQPDVENFVVKIVAEYASGRTRQGILLTNNYSDTQWFHHAQSRASAIAFTKGRIQFIAADGQPKPQPVQGQAFFYFGNAPDRFASEFSTYGFVVAPFRAGKQGCLND
jgi:ParB family chromosome partitioning protein